MKTAAEALALVLSHATALETERVDLSDARERVLREDAPADLDLPPFDSAAMDGYALASGDRNEWLEIAGEIRAGSGDGIKLRPGQCARIFTGAKLPAGADQVLMQEDAEVSGGRLRTPAGGVGAHIRKRGENCSRGEVVVPAGRRLRALDLAALASCGVAMPLVSRRARVAHFVMGDELVDPGQAPEGTQIRDCNSALVAALLAEWGAEMGRQSRLADDLAAGVKAIMALDAFDILLISGGAGAGDYDHARALLEKTGFGVVFHGVNLHPGKPLLFASRGRQLAFGLPGNPVSHAVIFRLFLAPLLGALAGCDSSLKFLQGVVDGEGFRDAGACEAFRHCHALWEEGAYRLRPVKIHSSGDIVGAAGANALLRVLPGRPVRRGERADFLWLQS